MDRISLPTFWAPSGDGYRELKEVQAAAAASLRKTQIFFLANPKNRSASTKLGGCLLKGNGSCLLVRVAEGKMAAVAVPAVGTDGSAAAAAADHGCLLVIVWLQCGTTTTYTYMNTLQLESKIKSSPSLFMQGIPTESASGNSSFDDDFQVSSAPPSNPRFSSNLATVVRGKKKAAELLLLLFHTCCRGQVCILNYASKQASKQASKAFFNWHPLLSMVCVEQNLFFSTCFG